MDENVYEREKLYNEVWTEPVLTVAKRYGVSNVALKKVCKSMNIPVPPPGYWTKVKMRARTARPKKPPLPAYNGPDITYGKRPNIERDKQGKRKILSTLSESERQKIIDACSSIEVKKQLRDPHSLIVEHQKEMDRPYS